MCEHGTSTIVPTPDWLWEARAAPERGISIDSCIAEAVVDAWDRGVRTLGSCCGHGRGPASVVLTEDHSQPELARGVLPGWELLQWRLVDVSVEGVLKQPD
jgi:hypothetical protein